MPTFLELAPHKNLRTGQSVWSAKRHVPLPLRPLRNSLKAEIVIVGAGISGAFMAHALSHFSSDILVLDRRGPSLGGTHASTAMLQFEIDTPLVRLAEQRGVLNAERAWLRS